MYSVQFYYENTTVCGGGADLGRWERGVKNCTQESTITFLSLPRGKTRGRINYSELEKEKKGKCLCLGSCVQVHRCVCVCVYGESEHLFELSRSDWPP